MLRITDQATDHLLHVRREKGLDADAIPRFIRRAGKLALTWAREAESGDRVVDGERVRTLVAPSAADLLEDRTIDVRATDERRWSLVVRRRRRKDAASTPRPSAIRHDRPAGATG